MNPKVAAFNVIQRQAAQPRALQVIQMRELGETWESIGKRLGVSRQRAQQIAKAHGHESKWGERKAKRDQRIKAFYATGKSMAETGAKFHISEGRVWQIVRDYQKV